MEDERPIETNLTEQIKTILSAEPGLSVKEIAERVNINRQFMAGALTVLEERGEVSHRQVGPARIYYRSNKTVGAVIQKDEEA